MMTHNLTKLHRHQLADRGGLKRAPAVTPPLTAGALLTTGHPPSTAKPSPAL